MPLKFGKDDDSIMHALATKLDIQSASTQLRKLGLYYLKPASDDGYHRFLLKNGETVAIITVERGNRFLVACDECVETIHDWHQWMDFTRALTNRLRRHTI